ncbi:MAG: hypothetical protein ACE5JX_20260 [Acidobacteriota bacterium]
MTGKKKKLAGTRAKAENTAVRRENVFQDGPYLVAALICEQVLEEKSGVKTAVRIIDRITQRMVGRDVPETMPPITASFKLLIKLKAGKKTGKHKMVVAFEEPFKGETQSLTQTIELEGSENSGIDLVLDLNIQLKQEGVHWFNIYCDDVLMTKTPVQVIYIIQTHAARRLPDRVQ